jgi:hypothetical protein
MSFRFLGCSIGRLPWPAALLVALGTLILLAGCGGGDEAPTPAPGAITEEDARQLYLGEMEKLGWFHEGDDVDIEVEYLLIAEAQAKVTDLGLSLYATLPGPPPYPDGLPGWLIVARGDFYEVEYPQTPGPDAQRRPAIGTGFVDREGRLTYGMKFTDVTPSPSAGP